MLRSQVKWFYASGILNKKQQKKEKKGFSSLASNKKINLYCTPGNCFKSNLRASGIPGYLSSECLRFDETFLT